MNIPNVNAHIHTPYSFSAFEKLTDALDKATVEDVKIVGINDFYTMDGYEEWNRESLKRHLYPLFNIEFISLQQEDQDKGIRVNDPNNPGRTYISGKGLCCPPKLLKAYQSQLDGVRDEANRQVQEMCRQINELLMVHNAGFGLSYEVIKSILTQGQVRERHLAKALRMSAYIHYKNKPEDIYAFFEEIFNNGKSLQSDIFDFAGVENEMRTNLLKAGGAAFVPEDPKAFLPMDNVCQIILAAGGIPTYPFLGDDAKGNFTEFENDLEQAAAILRQRNIFSAEFITTRNSIETLEKYAGYLHEAGFIVTFGTEHNTPAMEPLKLSARGIPLTDRLKQINYEGACVIAAHQELVHNGKMGYVDADGIADLSRREQFLKEGDTLINNIIQ